MDLDDILKQVATLGQGKKTIDVPILKEEVIPLEETGDNLDSILDQVSSPERRELKLATPSLSQSEVNDFLKGIGLAGEEKEKVPLSPQWEDKSGYGTLRKFLASPMRFSHPEKYGKDAELSTYRKYLESLYHPLMGSLSLGHVKASEAYNITEYAPTRGMRYSGYVTGMLPYIIGLKMLYKGVGGIPGLGKLAPIPKALTASGIAGGLLGSAEKPEEGGSRLMGGIKTAALFAGISGLGISYGVLKGKMNLKTIAKQRKVLTDAAKRIIERTDVLDTQGALIALKTVPHKQRAMVLNLIRAQKGQRIKPIYSKQDRLYIAVMNFLDKHSNYPLGKKVKAQIIYRYGQPKEWIAPAEERILDVALQSDRTEAVGRLLHDRMNKRELEETLQLLVQHRVKATTKPLSRFAKMELGRKGLAPPKQLPTPTVTPENIPSLADVLLKGGPISPGESERILQLMNKGAMEVQMGTRPDLTLRAKIAREEVDRLSGEIKELPIPDALKQTLEDNLGTYVGRFFTRESKATGILTKFFKGKRAVRVRGKEFEPRSLKEKKLYVERLTKQIHKLEKEAGELLSLRKINIAETPELKRAKKHSAFLYKRLRLFEGQGKTLEVAGLKKEISKAEGRVRKITTATLRSDIGRIAEARLKNKGATVEKIAKMKVEDIYPELELFTPESRERAARLAKAAAKEVPGVLRIFPGKSFAAGQEVPIHQAKKLGKIKRGNLLLSSSAQYRKIYGAPAEGKVGPRAYLTKRLWKDLGRSGTPTKGFPPVIKHSYYDTNTNTLKGPLLSGKSKEQLLRDKEVQYLLKKGFKEELFNKATKLGDTGLRVSDVVMSPEEEVKILLGHKRIPLGGTKKGRVLAPVSGLKGDPLTVSEGAPVYSKEGVIGLKKYHEKFLKAEDIIKKARTIHNKRMGLLGKAKELRKLRGKPMKPIDYPSTWKKEAGEVREAAYTVTRTINRMTYDLETMRLFEKVSRMPEIASTQAREGWVKVHQGKVRGIDKLGALEGKYIHPAVAEDLAYIGRIREEAERLYLRGLGFWKFLHVAMNPATHGRNLFSNAILLDASGISLHKQPGLLSAAGRSLQTKDRFYQLAYKNGLFGTEMIPAEATRFLKKWKGSGDMLSNITDFAMEDMGFKDMGKLYQFEEQIFKHAKFLDLMRRGMTPRAAVLECENWIFNYTKIPPAIRTIRQAKWGSPFITFQYKALPRCLESFIKNPLRLGKYPILLKMMERYAQKKFNLSDEELALLTEEPTGWRFDFLTFLLHVQDSKGNFRSMDFGYNFPFGSITEMHQMLGFLSNPAFRTIAELYTRRVRFLDQPILRKGASPTEAIQMVMLYLAKEFVPPLMSYPGVTMAKAAAGKKTYYGVEYDYPWEVAGSLFGLKTRPKKLQVEMMRRISKEFGIEMDLRRELRGTIKGQHTTPNEKLDLIREAWLRAQRKTRNTWKGIKFKDVPSVPRDPDKTKQGPVIEENVSELDEILKQVGERRTLR